MVGVHGLVNNPYAGTVTNSISILAEISCAATIMTNVYNYYAAQAAGIGALTGGINAATTIINNYGLYIDPVTIGTNKWAIYTNAGLVRLGDTINQVVTTALTNTVGTHLTLDHNSSNITDAGFGTRQLFRLKSSTTADQSAGSIITRWLSATHASYASQVVLAPWYAGTEREAIVATATSAGAITKLEYAQQGTYTTTAVGLALTTAHHWVVVTAASAITLPTAATYAGQEYIITATTTGTTVTANGAELINGINSWTLSADSTMQIKSDGTGWRII